MKKKPGGIQASNQNKTSLILLRAHALMTVYARATGACICIHDRNYMPIHELCEEMVGEKNTCLFCTKYKEHIED